MPVPIETVERIAAAHQITGRCELMAASGMVNEAWMLDGRFVLRITIIEEAFEEADREAWVVPLVRSAGIRSPELIVADSSRELVEFPYTIYERAKGELLGHLEIGVTEFSPVYRELGREMAVLHQIEITEKQRSGLRDTFTYADHAKIEKTLECGKINEAEAREIADWIARLEGAINDRSRRAFIHQDIHPWNVFVDPDRKELAAIIDWGDAAWGDPAGEFSSMPLVSMLDIFAGYEEAGGFIDDCMKARAILLGLGLELWELRELDARRFNRRWWRHPEGGFDEAFAICQAVLS